MGSSRYNPFKDLRELQERMNSLFEESIARGQGSGERGIQGMWKPAVDIYETEDHLVIKTELSGLDKDDFQLEVRENTITLSGERRSIGDVKDENVYRMERAYGPFQRVFTLPMLITESDVAAKLIDGVLEVTVTKKAESKPKQIKIDIT